MIEVFAPDLVRVVPPSGNLWGLFVSEDDLFCETYNDGSFIAGATRGSISYSGPTVLGGAVTMIHEDSEELVGPGSFVFQAGAALPATQIVVWDVVGNALHTRTLTAGDRCTTPVYLGGWLYWFEWQIAFAGTVTVSFRRSRCDLSSLTELETFDLDAQNGNSGGSGIGLVIPTEGDLTFGWATGNEDGHNQLKFWNKAIAPGAPIEVTDDFALALGIRDNADNPDWLDGSVGGASVFDPGAPLGARAYLSASILTAHDDGFDGGSRGSLQTYTAVAPSDLWPNNDGLWVPAGGTSLDFQGDFAITYAAGLLLRHDRSTPIIPGDPLFSGGVDPHQDLETTPDAMFFRIA